MLSGDARRSQGQDRNPTSGHEPANPKLWQLVVAQARAKFATYPSPAASHWVHKEYVQKGGTFKGKG
jgi:hypothetical protein